MRTLIQVAIIGVVIWFVCTWWKHRKMRDQTTSSANAAHAALGASTRVGSDLGSSSGVTSPQSLDYGQATPGAPTGAIALTNAPTSSSPTGSIFSGACGCN
jgi:hypothetical protein